MLWELTWFHTKKESHFKLLVELLNFAATHPTPKYLHQGRTVTIYKKLVDSHALIPNFKAVEKTFIDCFIPNINDFFHYLLDSDSYRVLAKHLLESKIPGLNLLDKQLNLTFNSFYGYTIINNKKSINEKLLDEEGMTFFQIVILDSVKTMRFDSKLLALANALIAYNEACVFQVDSQGKSVVDYLNSIQVDNLDKNYQDSYRDLCKLIKNKFYPFPQVGAFFCGRTKDTSNNSIVSQLPDELLCKIASLTLNLKPGQ